MEGRQWAKPDLSHPQWWKGLAGFIRQPSLSRPLTLGKCTSADESIQLVSFAHWSGATPDFEIAEIPYIQNKPSSRVIEGQNPREMLVTINTHDYHLVQVTTCGGSLDFFVECGFSY